MDFQCRCSQVLSNPCEVYCPSFIVDARFIITVTALNIVQTVPTARCYGTDCQTRLRSSWIIGHLFDTAESRSYNYEIFLTPKSFARRISMPRHILRTRLCEMLDIEYPVCLAGMGGMDGGYTPPELAAAVSEAGGLGVMGSTGIVPDELRKRIRRVRELTDKPFGVGLLLPVSTGQLDLRGGESARDAIRRDYPKHVAFVDTLIAEFGLEPSQEPRPEPVNALEMARQQVDVILDERVPVFTAGLGDPAWVMPKAREAGTIVMGLAGSVRNAMRQAEADVDIVVAQGTEAGGHTGRIATLPLIPQVVDAISPLPVVAAGGIANGKGIAAALALGAVGVWIGTAFLAATESRIYDVQRENILKGRSDEFVISRSFSGKTARVYRNPIVRAWEESGLEPLPMPLQGTLMGEFTSAASRAGRHDLVMAPAGQASGLVSESRPASEIMADLVAEAVDVISGLQERVTIDKN